MKALITSFGSTGDVQPMLALGAALQGAGHVVTMAFPPNFGARVTALGFAFEPLGDAVDPATIRTISTRMIASDSRADHTRQFLEVIVPSIPRVFERLLTLCRAADVLISMPYQIAARMVHDTLGIPFVTVHPSPFGMLGGKEVRDVTAPVINRVREHEGLPPLEDPLGADAPSPQLALHVVSRHVVNRLQGGDHQHLVGYLFLDEPGFQPDPRLQAFLNEGPPPVTLGFGSMVHANPQQVAAVLLGAVQKVGCRAVIQRGWSGLSPEDVPDNIGLADFIPHHWLFPRSALVVHHGGAGTTAAAFRAGVPAVVVPHMLEQPIWGEFARSLGCAPDIIPIAELGSDRLASAISAGLSGRFTPAALALAEKLRGEDGAGTSVRLIEGLLR